MCWRQRPSVRRVSCRPLEVEVVVEELTVPVVVAVVVVLVWSLVPSVVLVDVVVCRRPLVLVVTEEV